MELKKLITPDIVDLKLKSKNKKDVILELSQLLFEAGSITSPTEFYKDVLKREQVGPTGMGNFIAIPHGESSFVTHASVAIGRLDEPIEWESIDDTPARLIFLIAVPSENRVNDHLKILGKLAGKLVNEELITNLLKVNTKEEFIEEIVGK